MESAPDTSNNLSVDEDNRRRISYVEKMFRLPPNKLYIPGRTLLAEGVLKKMCRKKLKDRRFFLFTDIIIYGSNSRENWGSPKRIELIDTTVEDVDDDGDLINGFSLLSPKKSLTIYCREYNEKLQWMSVTADRIRILRDAAGYSTTSLVKQAPLWIPDSTTDRCMVCLKTEFNFISRRHHCRHCGKLVCSPCSSYRSVLPYQSSSLVRVCRDCHLELKKPQSVRNPTPAKVAPENPLDVQFDVITKPGSGCNLSSENGDSDAQERDAGVGPPLTSLSESSSFSDD